MIETAPEPHPHRRPSQWAPQDRLLLTHADFFELKNPLKVGSSPCRAAFFPAAAALSTWTYIPSFRQPLRALAQISAEDTGPHVPCGPHRGEQAEEAAARQSAQLGDLLPDWRRPSDVSGAESMVTIAKREEGDVDEEYEIPSTTRSCCFGFRTTRCSVRVGEGTVGRKVLTAPPPVHLRLVPLPMAFSFSPFGEQAAHVLASPPSG
ncbi:hypothetical protein B0H14DRAFT_3559049 [Mycena olivaceomarginata]|nr:hypothetical protein B0H14DRAFT_3559049 [Mycena olivaceomarginata]